MQWELVFKSRLMNWTHFRDFGKIKCGKKEKTLDFYFSSEQKKVLSTKWTLKIEIIFLRRLFIFNIVR